MDTHRLRLLFQTAAIKLIDPLFSRRHPGAALRALIRGLGPLVRCLQPNDRWNSVAFVDAWMRVLDVPPQGPLPKAKRIFIFSCYRGQFTYDLVLALMLAWRGHTVTYGYVPKLQGPIKDPLTDHPSAAGYLNAVLGGIAAGTRGKVRCIDLSAYAGREAACDESFLSAQLRSDIVLRLRQEKFDLDDPEVARDQRFYSELGRTAQRIALSYFSENRSEIDLCVIGNGASFENAQFCHAAKQLGIPVNTHEKFAFSKVRVITHGNAFFHFSDLGRIWAQRRELGLLDESMRAYVVGKAWDLLNERRHSSGRAWGWQFQKDTRSHSVEQLREKLGIEKERFVLVCPNVPFDAGYEGWLQIFPSMREWLVETVRFLLQQEGLQVVVRAHPAETRPGYGREQIAAVMEESGIRSDRLVLLPGDSDINTYDLMPLCKFAAVFASTTGVEIAMHGKPVVAGASVYYTQFGITVPVSRRDEYFARLTALAADQNPGGVVNAEDAAMVYFMFHYLLQWPYPYDKPSHIAAMPPADLVAHSSMRMYIQTLDVLSMTASEYEAALPQLIDIRRIADHWGWQPPCWREYEGL